LKEGLRLAKEDLEKARVIREKINSAKQTAQEEADRLESQVGRAEARAVAAQEGLNKARKELEEVRKRELKIKEKLKEFLDLQGLDIEGGLKFKNLKEVSIRISNMEEEIEVLRAQNLLLKHGGIDVPGTESVGVEQDGGVDAREGLLGRSPCIHTYICTYVYKYISVLRCMSFL
jgi:hypothetical protein